MADTVRFIHTADLHLDSPLRSLATRNPDLARLLRDASRTLLQRLIDTAIEQAVDALLIAGDLFDGGQRDVHTAMVLQRELRRLQDAQIPVFIIWGNHDAETRFMSDGVLELPDNVHVFDGRGGRRPFADERAMVHGVSYSKRQAPDSLLNKFGKPDPHAFNIGMLHTSLTGADGHNDYAPCTVNELIDKGFDYWALGHVHKRRIHHEQPAIVMPGNPLGRHVNEDGERSISLVTLESGKPASIRNITLAPVRFERLPVSLDGIHERRAAHDHLLETLDRCRQEIDCDILIVRLELHGASALARHYQRDRQTLLLSLQTEIEHREDLWIDSISAGALQSLDATDSDPDTVAGASMISELQSLISEDLLGSHELQQSVAADLAQLVKALPAEINDLFGETPEAENQRVRDELLPDGARWMLRQLQSPPGDGRDEDQTEIVSR